MKILGKLSGDRHVQPDCYVQGPLIYCYFEKVCWKILYLTIPKGNIGYDQCTFSDTVAVKSTLVAFLQHSQTYVHGFSCNSLKFI